MPPPLSRRTSIRLALGLFFVSWVACKPQETPKSSAPPPRNVALAEAWIDSAKAAPADHALALLVSALKADETSTEARELALNLLRETRWSVPLVSIAHSSPIDQIAFSNPNSAWVSLHGPQNTTVRWDLESLQIRSVLFPVPACQTRCLVFDSAHRSVVIQRGAIVLLCDALTLKPIRDLGTLPETFTPASVIVFSPDGLLMAHPTVVSPDDPSILWQLRDVATGEILRSSEPLPPTAPQALSATLDRTSLRVIHADGSLMEMPISPVEPIHTEAAASPITLLHAQFSTDQKTVLALQDQGPHRPATRTFLPATATADGSLESIGLAQRFPWSRQPTLWIGLIKDSELRVTGATLEQPGDAPIRTDSPITAIAFQSRTLITGEENGCLTLHQFLPHPSTLPAGPRAVVSTKTVMALEKLSAALSGTLYEKRTFHRLSTEQRFAAIKDCDFSALRSGFPELDFSALSAAFSSTPPRQASPEALLPLTERLAAAAPSPAAQDLIETFRSQDPIAINAAIQAAGGSGPAAAHALAISLASEHPEWIDACLTAATQLPPLLRKVARSRMALLHGQRAEALADWPEQFPELSAARLREDWLGWEQADFEPALAQVRQVVQDELTALQIPENSSPEQRKSVIAHLSDPQTVDRVGKRRFVDACLKAALVLADLKEDTATAFQLANFARTQGATPEPCLRVEAIALTNLGDFQNAHTRWIELITEYPVAAQQPGDYAEAAYTSFENSDPRQAMEILTTGLHRFPQDGNFALRAGWVALLTGNSEKAYRFLREGQRIGFPPAKQENATALLTIAASQSGAEDDATVYFNDLLRIDPAWNDPATLDSLSWPDELKSTLRQFMR
jgi:tetratricopeptide (TPR) repeat protein